MKHPSSDSATKFSVNIFDGPEPSTFMRTKPLKQCCQVTRLWPRARACPKCDCILCSVESLLWRRGYACSIIRGRVTTTWSTPGIRNVSKTVVQSGLKGLLTDCHPSPTIMSPTPQGTGSLNQSSWWEGPESILFSWKTGKQEACSVHKKQSNGTIYNAVLIIYKASTPSSWPALGCSWEAWHSLWVRSCDLQPPR